MESMQSEADAVSSFRPMADRILVRPDKPEERSTGGIILPRSVMNARREVIDRGQVVSHGPGMLCADGRRWPMPVKVGDRVIFDRAGSQRIRLGDEDLLLMRDDFILAVIEEGPEAAAAQ
jgi:chaperonin GroES